MQPSGREQARAEREPKLTNKLKLQKVAAAYIMPFISVKLTPDTMYVLVHVVHMYMCAGHVDTVDTSTVTVCQ